MDSTRKSENTKSRANNFDGANSNTVFPTHWEQNDFDEHRSSNNPKKKKCN